MNFVLVAIGGALGSVCRYCCTLWVAGGALHPAVGTLIVNVLGSFIIGLLVGVSGGWKLLAVTGFCGGFTTFSTFSLQTVQLLRQQLLVQALGNMAVSLVVGLGAVYAGMALSKFLI